MRPVLFSLGILLIAITSAGGADQYQPAKLVAYETSSLCRYNCPPDTPIYFNYCFQVDQQFLIGDAYGLQPEYDSAQLKKMQGRDLPIRFNDKNIWLIGPDGNEHKLKRMKSSTLFKNESCNAPKP